MAAFFVSAQQERALAWRAHNPTHAAAWSSNEMLSALSVVVNAQADA